MSRVELISGKVGVSLSVSTENRHYTCISIRRLVYLHRDYYAKVWE